MMIELNNLTYRYSTTTFNFNLKINTGELNVILGPSGAGKSTLLSLIAGFTLPDSGEIILNQQSCNNVVPAKRPISILFQDNNLFPHLNVYQNIALGMTPSLRLTLEQQQIVADIATELQLTPYLTRYPEALSGGQRQRVALARCFIREQPILLLDEPFAALDPRSRQTMLTLLHQRCKQRNITLLMVSHQINEVLNWAERAIVIDQGNVVFDGSVNDLQHKPSKISALLGLEETSY